jgi:hypothetical protein
VLLRRAQLLLRFWLLRLLLVELRWRRLLPLGSLVRRLRRWLLLRLLRAILLLRTILLLRAELLL